MAMRFRKSFWIVSALLAVLYVPIVPGCVNAHVRKEGSVVDALTHKGLPGAFVIATASVTTSGGLVEARTATDREYLFVTRTDASGKYSIPSTFSRLNFHHFVPGIGSLRESWKIVAFLPSYVYAKDMEWLPEAPKLAGYVAEPQPDWSWSGFHIASEPIFLQKNALPISQAVMYYRGYKTGYAPKAIPSEERNIDVVLSQLIKDQFVLWIGIQNWTMRR